MLWEKRWITARLSSSLPAIYRYIQIRIQICDQRGLRCCKHFCLCLTFPVGAQPIEIKRAALLPEAKLASFTARCHAAGQTWECNTVDLHCKKKCYLSQEKIFLKSILAINNYLILDNVWTLVTNQKPQLSPRPRWERGCEICLVRYT